MRIHAVARNRKAWLVMLFGVAVVAVLALYTAAGFFDREPIRMFGPSGGQPVAGHTPGGP